MRVFDQTAQAQFILARPVSRLCLPSALHDRPTIVPPSAIVRCGSRLQDLRRSHRITSICVNRAEDQQSLAIGRGGQNARLAAKLTSWRIDIKPASSRGMESEAALPPSPVGVEL